MILSCFINVPWKLIGFLGDSFVFKDQFHLPEYSFITRQKRWGCLLYSPCCRNKRFYIFRSTHTDLLYRANGIFCKQNLKFYYCSLSVVKWSIEIQTHVFQIDSNTFQTSMLSMDSLRSASGYTGRPMKYERPGINFNIYYPLFQYSKGEYHAL